MTSQHLEKILQEARALQAQGQQTLAVFDLDSTLFDVSPRIKKVLHHFSELPQFQRKFPEACEILSKAETFRSDWGVKNAVIRAGLDKHHPEFHQALKEFWLKNFFSNEYLDYDIPYEGAVEYTRQLFQMGCQIVYLTGRDVFRMGKGSREVLLKWNFPLDENQAQLVLKPERGLNDAEFKSNWFASLPQNQFAKIWFFENEPVNVNLVRVRHAHVEIVFFDSTHSGKEQPPPDLPRVMNFLIQKGEAP